ncbi:MAG: TetR/AcrR family transcriptional regulator [Nocardiopsaceae bacterium]|nr:TetR/AcrR family transcriptional regulator [Nocardiopsaceae bacterium]
MPGTDRRVRRTRALLHQALIELILEKGYGRITVQDILDRADVGRSTFYSHYRDKDALLLDNGGSTTRCHSLPSRCTTASKSWPPTESSPCCRNIPRCVPAKLTAALVNPQGRKRGAGRDATIRSGKSWVRAVRMAATRAAVVSPRAARPHPGAVISPWGPGCRSARCR